MRHLSPAAMILFGSWWAFILFWGVMAIRTKKTVHKQPRSEMRLYLYPLLIGVLIMSGLTRSLGPLALLARPLLQRTMALQWTAAAAALLGLAIAIWARVALGTNWSGEVTLKEDHALVTNGPYAAIRHPIYTALILLFLGLAIFIASAGAWIGMALIVLSCWIKLRQEEALMLRQFPADYPAYMARTKRLIPWLV
jgi:protein-S-isoprenylcysteine O-methyltransferase Ste14